MFWLGFCWNGLLGCALGRGLGGFMGNRASKRVDEAIARSEEKGLLYHPDSESARRSCRRRVASGTLVEPFPGLFARKAHWGHVKPWVRPYQLVRSLASVHPEWVFASF